VIQKLKAFWASLPHQVQVILLGVGTAALTAFLHAVENGNCYSADCLKHYVASAVAAGLAAGRAFYMLPNRQVPPQPPAA
jgi:hypothetical protein